MMMENGIGIVRDRKVMVVFEGKIWPHTDLTPSRDGGGRISLPYDPLKSFFSAKALVGYIAEFKFPFSSKSFLLQAFNQTPMLLSYLNEFLKEQLERCPCDQGIRQRLNQCDCVLNGQKDLTA